MLDFMLDKWVMVQRYTSTLDTEYNRPVETLELIGGYFCHISEDTTSTSQLQPQKNNTTDLNLYVEPDADIRLGDVLYIYEIDDYDEIIPDTEFKALADKPYKKRTVLKVPLVGAQEV